MKATSLVPLRALVLVLIAAVGVDGQCGQLDGSHGCGVSASGGCDRWYDYKWHLATCESKETCDDKCVEDYYNPHVEYYTQWQDDCVWAAWEGSNDCNVNDEYRDQYNYCTGACKIYWGECDGHCDVPPPTYLCEPPRACVDPTATAVCDPSEVCVEPPAPEVVCEDWHEMYEMGYSHTFCDLNVNMQYMGWMHPVDCILVCAAMGEGCCQTSAYGQRGDTGMGACKWREGWHEDTLRYTPYPNGFDVRVTRCSTQPAGAGVEAPEAGTVTAAKDKDRGHRLGVEELEAAVAHFEAELAAARQEQEQGQAAEDQEQEEAKSGAEKVEAAIAASKAATAQLKSKLATARAAEKQEDKEQQQQQQAKPSALADVLNLLGTGAGAAGTGGGGRVSAEAEAKAQEARGLGIASAEAETKADREVV